MEGAAGMDSSNSVDNLEGDPVVGGAQNWAVEAAKEAEVFHKEAEAYLGVEVDSIAHH